MEQVDIQATEGETQDTVAQPTTPDRDTAQAPTQADHATTQHEERSDPKQADSNAPKQAGKSYVPFATGKEKFKVNGQEHEWDWETTKRYAQIGRSGQIAMERAAEVERKATDAYQKLYAMAQSDPEGLIQTLNPTWQPGRSKARGSQTQLPGTTQQGDQADAPNDPRDEKIFELERRLGEFEQDREQSRVNEEKAAIQNELDTAVKSFPILDQPVYRDLILAQYTRHLKAGIENITIEDVAFTVSEQLKESRQKEAQAQKQKIEENRKRAPVSAVPGTAGPHKAPQSFDDVRRLAGLI